MSKKFIRREIFFITFSIPLIFISNLHSEENYKKNYLFFYGGMNLIGKTGSEADYVAGENDFPVTPSHQTAGFGGGYFRFLSKRIFVGGEFQYNLNTKVELEDPSDGEKIKINTYKNLSLIMNVGYNIIHSKRLILFLNGGAGINQIYGKREEFISNRGNFIEIEPPKRKANFALNGGLGSILSLSQKIGVSLNFQYLYIFMEDPQNLLSPTIGIVFKF